MAVTETDRSPFLGGGGVKLRSKKIALQQVGLRTGLLGLLGFAKNITETDRSPFLGGGGLGSGGLGCGNGVIRIFDLGG